VEENLFLRGGYMNVRMQIDLSLDFYDSLDLAVKKTVEIFLDRGMTMEEILASMTQEEKKIALKVKKAFNM